MIQPLFKLSVTHWVASQRSFSLRTLPDRERLALLAVTRICVPSDKVVA